MLSYRIEVEDYHFNLNDFDVETLQTVADSGGVIYWDCGGLVGKVPNSVLVDALGVHEQWDWLEENHVVDTPPLALDLIYWEQTVTPKNSKAAERAPLLRPRY